MQKKVSFTKYHPDLVEYAIEEKEKIPGGWNGQMETNITKYASGGVEKVTRRRERRYLVD